MSQTQNIHMYIDVAQVLDSALAAGGAVYELEDRKAAVRWRFRAYYYRTLLMKEQAKLLPEGATPRTPYDHMVVNLEGNSCRIEVIKPVGKLKSLAGDPLDFVAPPAPAVEPPVADTNDPLLAAAKRMVGNLPLDDE